MDHVFTLMAAGRLIEGDAATVARQVWSAVHGAVALEMGGLVAPDEAEASYRRVLVMIVRGLAVPGTLVFPDPQGPPGTPEKRSDQDE